MHTLTLEQFNRILEQKKDEINKAIRVDLPIIIGKEAVDVFKENFQKEAWGRTKWKEVERRKAGTPANKYARKRYTNSWNSKILTGRSGDLGRSIKYKEGVGKVTISSDVVYAAVHNWGLRAGRGRGFTMPQRQFIGENEELTKRIEAAINKKLNKIFTL